jgi:hypothetical protein
MGLGSLWKNFSHIVAFVSRFGIKYDSINSILGRSVGCQQHGINSCDFMSMSPDCFCSLSFRRYCVNNVEPWARNLILESLMTSAINDHAVNEYNSIVMLWPNHNTADYCLLWQISFCYRLDLCCSSLFDLVILWRNIIIIIIYCRTFAKVTAGPAEGIGMPTAAVSPSPTATRSCPHS